MSTSIGSGELFRDPPRRPRYRRTIAASVALMLGVTGIGAAVAATEITQRNPTPAPRLTVGPVNAEHGFPAWYEDTSKTRAELCLDADDPLCGFLPGDVPDPTKPISFPDNFPHEAFYMLAGSDVAIPGGGTATLTLALEAAFANEEAVHGDQVVFARQRIDVRDAAPGSTYTFKHPYGEITIDTDERGRGRLVEDVSPSIGNFQTPVKGAVGPFLKWDSGAPEGYLGNPDVEHTVTGGPLRNTFEVLTPAGATAVNDQFTVMGKVATNTGVQADRAVVSGDGYIDVFATSRGDQLQVEGQEGVFETTPMEKEDGDSERAYARIKYTGTAPTKVKISNLGDKPVSAAEVAVTDVSISTGATYDGTSLKVTATSASASQLEVKGFGTLTAGAEGSFATVAPPVEVTVAAAGKGETTVPVVVTGGTASPAGQAPIPASPDGGAVVDKTPDNAGEQPPGEQPPAATAAISALPGSVSRGIPAELDGSGSANATKYEWSQVDDPNAPKVAFDRTDVAKPKVTVPLFTTTGATAPKTADTDPVVKLVTINAAGVRSEAATITLKSDDVVSVAAASRHRVGKEIRLTGTATVPGQPTLLNPATSVNIYNAGAGTPVKIGSAPVDTLGNWEYRAKPGPGQQVSRILVESTRGGTAMGAVAAG
jgi:hypothetical protein